MRWRAQAELMAKAANAKFRVNAPREEMRNPKFKVASAFGGLLCRVELNRESMVSYSRDTAGEWVKFENVTLYYPEGDLMITSKPFYAPIDNVRVTWNNGG